MFVVVVNPEGEWHHSRFPDPFLTVDYDVDDKVVRLVAVGTAAHALAASMRDSVLHALDPVDEQHTHVVKDLERALTAV